MKKEKLTNESLRKHFKNNFDLANYAIGVAQYLIKAGHEIDIDTLLADIERNPKQFTPESLAAMELADEEEDERE